MDWSLLHRAHKESRSLPSPSYTSQEPTPFCCSGHNDNFPQLLSPGQTVSAICQWATSVHFQPNICRRLERGSKTASGTPDGHPDCGYQWSEGLGFCPKWIYLSKRVRYSPSLLPNMGAHVHQHAQLYPTHRTSHSCSARRKKRMENWIWALYPAAGSCIERGFSTTTLYAAQQEYWAHQFICLTQLLNFQKSRCRAKQDRHKDTNAAVTFSQTPGLSGGVACPCSVVG